MSIIKNKSVVIMSLVILSLAGNQTGARAAQGNLGFYLALKVITPILLGITGIPYLWRLYSGRSKLKGVRLNRLLVAAACLGMLPSTAYTGTTYYNSDSVWKTAAEAEVGSWIRFPTVQINIQKADQVAGIVGDNEQLGKTLGFDKNNTGLCQGVYLQTVEAGAGFTFNDTEGSGLVFTPNALSVGDVDNYENDDFELTFNAGFGLPRAVGFYIVGNTAQLGENIQVYGVGNTLLYTGGLPGYSETGAFAGFVSTEGIAKIRINESSAGGDDIAMKDVLLGPNATSQSGDFDGLSDCDEVNLYGTNPLDNDTDNDNLLDGWEVQYGFDPIGTNESALDTDSDLMTNQQEQAAGTLPNNPDTDGDTLLDGAELANTALGYDPLFSNTLRPGDISVNGNIVGIGADLTNADFTDADLTGVNLTGIDLTGTTLTGVSGQLLAASGTTLPTGYTIVNNYILGPDVDLTGADLTDADLTGADLSGATLIGVSGQLLASTGVILPQGYVITGEVGGLIVGPGIELTNLDLTNADLTGADLTGLDLTGTTLAGVRGQLLPSTGVILPPDYVIVNNYIVGPGVDLRGARLGCYDLNSGGSCVEVDLTGVNLTGALLNDAYLQAVNFTDANLTDADFSGAYLDFSRLTGANVTRTNFGGGLLELLSSGPLLASTGVILPPGYVIANNYIVGPWLYLTGVDLEEGDLTNADLSGTFLRDADLSGTTLTGVSGCMYDGYGVKLPPGYITTTYQSLCNRIVGPGIDLTNVDLSYVDLTGADLTGLDLTGTTLAGVRGQLLPSTGVILPPDYVIANNYIVGPGVDLRGARLGCYDLNSGGSCVEVDLTGVNLTGALLNDAYLQAVNFTDANLTDADFSGAYLDFSRLTGANVTRTNFGGGLLELLSSGPLLASTGVILPPGYVIANNYIVGPWLYLTGVDLEEGDLTNVDLSGTFLRDADLSGTTLTGVSGCMYDGYGVKLPPGYTTTTYQSVCNRIVGPGIDLTNVDLSYSDLTGADLTGQDLTGATLVYVSGQLLASTGVILPPDYVIVNNYIVGPYVNLTGADLTGQNLTETNLTGATLTNASLGLANLTNTVGLDTTTGSATYFNTNFTGTGFDPVASGWTLCANVDENNVCVLTCPSLSAPLNGSLNLSHGNTYPSIASYSCDSGSVLIGSSTLDCLPGGSWDGTPPSCPRYGDLAPRGSPDNLVNAGDLLIMTRIIIGVIQPTPVETGVGDINGNGDLDIADLLLMQQNLLNSPEP
jgi:uncharacterized protein YjbI with pentapeptide repeats